jgi:hypothetical protein
MSVIFKPMLLVGVALAVASPMPRPSRAAGLRANVRITILVLNGKNGRPMKHLLLNVNTVPRMPADYPPNWWTWTGPPGVSPTRFLRTDGSGTVTVRVPRDGALEVSTGGFTEECRPELRSNKYPKYPLSGSLALYPVEGILSHGTVSENTCGKGHAVPVPGRLVIFARPMTFWERMRT